MLSLPEALSTLKSLSKIFKALGDPTRLRIIRILASNMEYRLCVSDLAQKLGITQPAASQHLKVLKYLNILNSKKEGFRVYYYLNIDALHKYKAQIDEIFKEAFMKCSYGGQCSTCPRNEQCS